MTGYLITKPFYLFQSGNPQIADGLIILASLVAAFSGLRPSAVHKGIFQLIILFSVWTFFVNWTWAVIVNDLSMIKAPAFYAFNAVVVFVILALYDRIGERALKVILFGTFAAVLLQVFLAILFGPESFKQSERAIRSILFFNNPNQLGYWALLSATIFALLSKRVTVPVIVQLIFFSVTFYLVAIALGKAATVSFFFLLAIHFTRRPSHLVLAIIVGLVGFMVIQDSEMIDRLAHRLADIGGQEDDSAAGRGYNRILVYPEYLLLGAGERGYSRFVGVTNELHSTFGTIIFSYGFIGAVIFTAMLYRLYRIAGFANFMYLGPPFLYGLTHQGLRFSLLWVLFAVAAITCSNSQQKEHMHQRRTGSHQSLTELQPAKKITD